MTTPSDASKRKRSPSKEPIATLQEATVTPKRPKLLHLIIPEALNSGLQHTEVSSPDSLFSGSDDGWSLSSDDDQVTNVAPDIRDNDQVVAVRTLPPIPGLYFAPDVRLPQELADLVTSFCMKTYFTSPLDNQVMLFGRFSSDDDTSSSSGFPPVLLNLLDVVSQSLHPVLPPEIFDLLFPKVPTQARQAIINLYQQGEGITPHVDLLGRYGDGIFGISFSSGCTMRFDEVDAPNARWDVFLPERSVIVMTGDARYKWTHGIEKKTKDLVSSGEEGNTWIERGTRMSVTFRWLLPGADVVGE